VRRAAVVVHPGKHTDLERFRSTVNKVMAAHGWAAPVWLETRPDDTGERLASQAVRSGVDLVIASGGDGTVTACAAGVAGSGVPLGVLPAGTGNLFARNLGLPFDTDGALSVALTGAERRVDVGVANGRPFIVMAGIGFDAEMLAGTSETLKGRAGAVAYLLSGLRHLWDRPTRVLLRADAGPPVRRWASGVIAGNVGTLQGNLRLLPDARPDDGVLDAAVLTAWGLIGWLGLVADVLLLRRKTARLTRLVCRELLVVTWRARTWEVDGEVIGPARRFRVSVRPGDLLVRVPRALARPAQRQDDPLVRQVLCEVAQPAADGGQRQFDEDREDDGLRQLAPRRRHDVEPGVYGEQRRGRRGGHRQPPRPAQREVSRGGERDHQHDVEPDPRDVVAVGDLPSRQGVPQVDRPWDEDDGEQDEGRARPADHPGGVGLHCVSVALIVCQGIARSGSHCGWPPFVRDKRIEFSHLEKLDSLYGAVVYN
jgi:YegS/Rv2252/BmrU family lipid kinase